MTPLTLDDALEQLRLAYLDGDTERIEYAEATVDRLDKTTPAPAVLASALWYAQAGLRIFPLSPRSKVPHPGTHGCKDATTDTDLIRAWWRQWPDSNVGLATGHLIDVVDIDGTEGHAAWGRAYGESWANLDILATVSTPRPGGMHLYVPANPAVGNGANLLNHVDYRGAGGYVVAPPSVTDVGTYEFLRPLDPTTLRASVGGAA